MIGFGYYWSVRPDTSGRRAVTALPVVIHPTGSVSDTQDYPIPHQRGVIHKFDGRDVVNPRFGPPSAVLVAQLKTAQR